MRIERYVLAGLIVGLAVIAVLARDSSADDELARRATWSVPTTAEVKARLDDFLKDKTLNEADRLKLDALWPDDAAVIDPAELLDRLAASLAIVEPRAVEIVLHCQQDAVPIPLPRFALLDD